MPDPTCYCHALRKATRRLNAAYDAALAPTGINVAQFSLLRTLARHGAQSLTGLGRRMELDRSTVGRNVKVVERLGLVQPASTTDQRQAAIELSPEGRRILASATPLWAEVQARIDTRLGPDRSATLLAELGRTHHSTDPENPDARLAHSACSRRRHPPSGDRPMLRHPIAWALAACLASACRRAVAASADEVLSFDRRSARFRRAEPGRSARTAASTSPTNSWSSNPEPRLRHPRQGRGDRPDRRPRRLRPRRRRPRRDGRVTSPARPAAAPARGHRRRLPRRELRTRRHPARDARHADHRHPPDARGRRQARADARRRAGARDLHLHRHACDRARHARGRRRLAADAARAGSPGTAAATASPPTAAQSWR